MGLPVKRGQKENLVMMSLDVIFKKKTMNWRRRLRRSQRHRRKTRRG